MDQDSIRAMREGRATYGDYGTLTAPIILLSIASVSGQLQHVTVSFELGVLKVTVKPTWKLVKMQLSAFCMVVGKVCNHP